MIIGLCFNGLMALGMALVLRAAGGHGALQGAMWGLILTVLFVLPAHSGKWTWQDKPLLLALDTGGHLLSLVASGLIIGGWPNRAARARKQKDGSRTGWSDERFPAQLRHRPR